MFHSFFPRPKVFFLSFVVWALFCVVLWFAAARGWGPALSFGGLIGWGYPAALPDGADEAAQAAFADQQGYALNFWFYQYVLLAYAIFVTAWMRLVPHEWSRWSVLGSAVIVFSLWVQVQLDVMINTWFGTFYDLVQRALAEPNSITTGEFNGALAEFMLIAMAYVMIFVAVHFFSQHYVFRWRTAINNYYTGLWPRVRHIEGASQRIQEDAKRFSDIMENLGTALIESVMTLIAFLPILWVLSDQIESIPFFGEVPKSLVIIAIIWSIGGTILLAVVGMKLPGLYFRIQREEAAYRKELVLGEDNAERAKPPSLIDLFSGVRREYFNLYFHYLYFNVARITYLQSSVLVAYVAMGPSIVAAGITLGVMQQTVRAFSRVQESFQFLVRSWPVIVELISIYKRLKAFEATIAGQELDAIEKEVEQQGPTPAPTATPAQ